MKIIIGSDRSGLPLKEEIKKYLAEKKGYAVEDCGMLSGGEFKAYYEVAPALARKIRSGEYDKGILICGTGQGMAITANKFKRVYAACCESVYAGGRASIINRANVLTMGGWVTAPEAGIEIVEAWLTKKFGEGFDDERVEFLQNAFEEVKKIENDNFK